MALVETDYIDPTKPIAPQGTDAYAYLQQANQAALAAQQARTQMAIAGYEGQVPTIHEDYDALARQSYQGLIGQQRGAANQLASAGLYNSGYADTYKTMQQTAYGQQLNMQELERQRQLRAIEESIMQARMSGDAALGDINTQYAYQLAQQMNADRAFGLQQQQFAWQKQQAAAAAKAQQQQQIEKELDPIQAAKGIELARTFIRNMEGGDRLGLAQKLLNDPTAMGVIEKQFGADAAIAYRNTILSELPELQQAFSAPISPMQSNIGAVTNKYLSFATQAEADKWFEKERVYMTQEEAEALLEYKKKYEGKMWASRPNNAEPLQTKVARLAEINLGIGVY